MRYFYLFLCLESSVDLFSIQSGIDALQNQINTKALQNNSSTVIYDLLTRIDIPKEENQELTARITKCEETLNYYTGHLNDIITVRKRPVEL